MKKTVACILVVCLALAAAVGITAVTEELSPKAERIAVITDIHVISDEYISTQKGYDHYAGVDKLEMVSLAIFNTIIDNILADDTIKAVLISGDLTENGDKKCHAEVQKCLKRIEEKIPVFVINGNHDLSQYSIYKDTAVKIPFLDEFKQIYADFGYNEALSVHDKSGSYTADLTDNLRLIAIDNNTYYTEETYSPELMKEPISDELLQWTETQLKAAATDGKTPIAMYHQPLLPQLLSLFHASSGDNGTKLFNLLSDYGVKLAICGHNHGQKISVGKSKKGVCYEIMTAATVFYSSCYRTIDVYGDKADVVTHYTEKLDGKYVSQFASPEDKALMTTDFISFMKKSLAGYFSRLVVNTVKGIGKNNAALSYLIDNSAVKAVNAKLYGEGSLSEIVKEYTGEELPKTEYETVAQMAEFFVRLVDSGDQKVNSETPEVKILECAILSAFYNLQEAVNADPSFGDDMKLHFDYSELFSGKLELIGSNFLHFALVYLTEAQITDIDLTMFDMNNLNFIHDYAVILDDLIVEGLALGTMIQPFIGSTYLDLLPLIREVGYNNLAKSMLNDEPPADNNVTLTWNKN